MKTPISVIKNQAELLQDEAHLGEDRIEYAKTIEDAAGRLADLIGNILKLNKLENQRIAPEVEPYDVCRQLCDCAISLRTPGRKRRSNWRWILRNGRWCWRMKISWNWSGTICCRMREVHGAGREDYHFPDPGERKYPGLCVRYRLRYG